MTDHNVVSGQDAVIVVNLLSALNRSLISNAESAQLMYTESDERNLSSDVLASKITSAASEDAGDLSSWDLNALCVVTLQQLVHMSHTVGGLLSEDHLNDNSPLLNGPEEMKLQVSTSWKDVWNILLEHFHLLHKCGRCYNDILAVFVPYLIPTEKLREKARLQLLCVLQPMDEQSSFSSEGQSKTTSQIEFEDVSAKEEQLSFHSSLLSEGTAMDEIEKELLLTTHNENESSLAKTPPISLPPPSLSTHHYLDDSSTISDDNSLTPCSPANVPTAIEQRSTTLPPLKTSLKRRLGFHGDSDSDDLSMVTPLGNHSNNDDEIEDFDF